MVTARKVSLTDAIADMRAMADDLEKTLREHPENIMAEISDQGYIKTFNWKNRTSLTLSVALPCNENEAAEFKGLLCE